MGSVLSTDLTRLSIGGPLQGVCFPKVLPEPREMAWKRDNWSDENGMSLPAGRTCADCQLVARCSAFLGPSFDSANEVCDWSPSRFRAKETAAVTAVPDGNTGE